MQEVLLSFEKIHIADEVLKIILHKNASKRISSSKKPYKRIGKCLEQNVASFALQGHSVNNSGLGLAGYLRNLGYELSDIYLAHKIASKEITTHYYSLEAESVTPFLEKHPEIIPLACGSFHSKKFRKIRLFLVFLFEISRTNLSELLHKSMKLKNSKDVEKIPEIIILLIKASAEI